MQSIISVGNSQIGKLLEGEKNPQVTEAAISKYCGEKRKKEEKGLMRQIAFNYA